jgi:hypothetical protein
MSERKLTKILENDFCFRDYTILPSEVFGSVNKVGVHQAVESVDDIESAIYNFSRDGFGHIYFYINK